MVEDVSIDSNKAASLAIVDDDDDMILNCILNVGLQETDFCLLHSIVTDFWSKYRNKILRLAIIPLFTTLCILITAKRPP